MSNIAESFQILYDIKENIKASIENKGVAVGDAPFTDYSSKIDEIPLDPFDGNYDEGYAEGYDSGRIDGYINGENDQKSRLTAIEITENGNYTSEDGYSEVTVSVDLETPYNNGYSDGLSVGDTQGYDRGHKDGMDEQKSKLTTITITENGPYTKEDGYSQVIVNVQGDPNAGYDDGYNTGYNNGYASGKTDGYTEGYGNGYSTGTTVGYGNGVADTKAKMTTLEVTENGTYDNADGYNKVIAKIDLETPYNNGYQTGVVDTKAKMTSITIDANGNYVNDNGWREITVEIARTGGEEGAYNEGYANGYEDGLAESSDTIRLKAANNLFKLSDAVIDGSVIVDCDGLTKLPTYAFQNSVFNNGKSPLLTNTENVKEVKTTFAGAKFEEALYFDTQNVESMNKMFSSCKSLTKVPLYNTSKVTDMSYMFESCESLSSIPQFDTTNVTNMGNMFSKCNSLVNAPNLDTSNVTNMSSMFSYCKNLNIVPNYNTSNVTNMSYMFYSCENLTTIPQLDTRGITTINGFSYMFNNCNNLTSIPVLDASNVPYEGATKYMYVIGYCSKLVDFGGFIGLRNNIKFSYCNSLSRESVLNIINLADTVTNGQYMAFHKDVIARLTEEDIALAQSKGWTINQG